MAWTDCAASTLDTNAALHAGAVVEFVRGNLIQAQSQSGYDVQTFHHSSVELYHELSTANAWERFGQFHVAVLPARPADDGAWRRLRVTAEGRRDGGSGVATIRLYAGNTEMLSEPHSTGGYLEWSAYGELTFSTSSYAIGSTTFEVARVGGLRASNLSTAMLSTMGYAGATQVVFLNAIAKCTAVRKVLLRAPRFDEEASS
jgi:hypothetical protein